jgi:hypothetical protein
MEKNSEEILPRHVYKLGQIQIPWYLKFKSPLKSKQLTH